MSCTAAPPDGTHVANTRPLLGAFVTVTGCSPVRVLAAVTQRVWPLEFPQLLLASAFPGIRTVAATSTQKTPREARRFRDEPITSRLPPFGPIRFSLASRRSPMSVSSAARRPLEAAGARQEAWPPRSPEGYADGGGATSRTWCSRPTQSRTSAQQAALRDRRTARSRPGTAVMRGAVLWRGEKAPLGFGLTRAGR